MENKGAKRAASQHSGSRTNPRGRPARISREMILDAAARLSHNSPEEMPSLNGIARAMKISPMAIYTYFAGKDELLQALSDRLLADFTLEIPSGTDPLEALTLWAHAMRAHVLAHPQLINLLVWEGGHTSIAWLERAMPVAGALTRLGLAGEGLAQATLWVWHVVMGAIHVELRNRAMPQEMSMRELASLDPATRALLDDMLALTGAPDHADSFFAYQLERMRDGLRAMVKARE